MESCGGFPHFGEVEFEGNFSIAKLHFTDPDFPGKISLTAFNPFIPLDSDASGLPAAFFEVEFSNNTAEDLEYTVSLNMKNTLAGGENRFFLDENGGGV